MGLFFLMFGPYVAALRNEPPAVEPVLSLHSEASQLLRALNRDDSVQLSSLRVLGKILLTGGFSLVVCP